MNGQVKQLQDLCDLRVQNRSFFAAKAEQNTPLDQANANDSLLICEDCFVETLFGCSTHPPC